MLLYIFPLLIGLLGIFCMVERHHIVQLLPEVNTQILLVLGSIYLALSILGTGLLYYFGEQAFIIWVIGILLLTTFLPVMLLLAKK